MFMSNSILVINVKSTVNVRYDVKDTLKSLRITKRFAANIIPNNPISQGMLYQAKHHVAWSIIDHKLITKILKLRIKFGSKKISDELIKSIGYKDVETLSKDIEKGDFTLKKIDNLRPSISFPPPKGGFKRSTRRLYTQGGILGANPDLPNIVEKMLINI